MLNWCTYLQSIFLLLLVTKMSGIRRTLLSRGPKRFNPKGKSNDCSPVKWSKYFEREERIQVNKNTFNVYRSGNNGPVLLLIHGGGYSALTWSLFAEELNYRVECCILAIDLRGHGRTCTEDEHNLALDVLASDVEGVINNIYKDEPVPFVLIGHSLGGAVAVEAARRIRGVVGVCVIDVVEGTALDSLPSMQSILRGRPKSFNSIEQAIQWSYRSGQTQNIDAARVSMPGQIKNAITGELAASENWDETSSTEIKTKISRLCDTKNTSLLLIQEEEEESNEQWGEHSNTDRNGVPEIKVPTVVNKYIFRIDLQNTELFWTGWFQGLSQKFLDLQAPKVLLLANIHGLDRTLTVGQMQGKFQLQVLSRSGHAIHEDQPHHVADIIASFLLKQRLAETRNNFSIIMPAC